MKFLNKAKALATIAAATVVTSTPAYAEAAAQLDTSDIISYLAAGLITVGAVIIVVWQFGGLRMIASKVMGVLR